MILLYFFLFGLIIGSFLNVVVLRSEGQESIGGRSRCPKCRALIRWYDNIPLLSFLFLRGRCRSCQGSISWQYPLVELCTGLTFVILSLCFFSPSYVFGNVFLTPFFQWELIVLLGVYLVLASILIAILVADIRTMEISLPWLVAGVVVALILMMLTSLIPSQHSLGWMSVSWTSQLWGGVVATLFFYALVFFSKETWMGMGDVWLAAILGLTVGIEMLLVSLTLSFLFGAVVGITLLVLQRKGWRSQIAFAPFLVIAILLSWCIQWVNPSWLGYILFPIEMFTF